MYLFIRRLPYDGAAINRQAKNPLDFTIVRARARFSPRPARVDAGGSRKLLGAATSLLQEDAIREQQSASRDAAQYIKVRARARSRLSERRAFL